MKTSIDCIPCFFKQAIEASRVAGVSKKIQKEIIDAVAGAVTEFPMDTEPPRMAIYLHTALRKASGLSDPYRELKRKSNQQVRSAMPGIERRLAASSCKIKSAAEFAVAANIIDFGAQAQLDLEAEVERIVKLERSEETQPNGPFRFEAFQTALAEHAKGDVLWIGDNAGEMFFDTLLIREILREYPQMKITYAVRGGPIINDGTYEDAVEAGIDAHVPIIDTGLQAPGAVLDLCGETFRNHFHQADIIISKGQGNFEALSACGKSVFFLFMVKCAVVSAHTGLPKGTIVLAEGDGSEHLDCM